eukprot:Phypoly_transcript_19699.p1 GENE.Phypoly_transcript_19699~~Phypoly_transcript_19699.p1  ORF type:complete len:168 (+),score=35.36 Phypoly_transcript_19699:158-661(+)
MSDTVKPATAGSHWVTNWIYGMDSFPSDKNLLDLIKAVFICAGGDGEVSKTERDFFFGYLDAVGIPASLHEFVKTYPAKESLEDVMKANPSAINEATKRVIIYTAIIVAGSDGYADGEHTQIVKMAAKLGVDNSVVDQIRKQYEADQKLRQERISLLFPGEHPWGKK